MLSNDYTVIMELLPMWMGRFVRGRRPLGAVHIHQMNRVNTRNDLVVMMTAL